MATITGLVTLENHFPGEFSAYEPGAGTSKGASMQLVTSLTPWSIGHKAPAAINATATATALQVSSGYITSTSAASTSITFPTGTLLGQAINATQGTTFDLYVDNTAGASTVTMVVGTNAILSAAAAANSASFGLLTVPAGVTGIARFTLVFSSATAYTITRTA